MTPRLYADLARLWPILSPPSDYLAEASLVAELLDAHLPPTTADHTPTLVELGAGAGHTLHHLRAAYECVAVDTADEMLALCRALNPDVHAMLGDMRTLDLFQSFDAVLLHDAVDYMTTAEDAHATIDTAARHLEPAGVFILAPTYVTETFTDGESAADDASDPASGTHVAYTSTVHRTSDTTFDLVMDLAITQADNTTTVRDVHPCGLFPREAWRAWLLDAGFDVTLHEPQEAAALTYLAIKQ